MPARQTDAHQRRTLAIQGFAAQLRELRVSAHSPSFREMSRRSGAISYTTLHDAVQGSRLPSWATTAEFVKACGADPAAYRARWAAANRAVHAAASEILTAEHPQPDLTPAEDAAAIEATRTTDRASTQDHGNVHTAAPGLWWRRRLVVIGAAALLFTGAAIPAALLLADGASVRGDQVSVATDETLTSADCPVKQQNPRPTPPKHRGDRATFVDDITLPDCTRVDPGSTMKKVWRFKNRGTVPWRGYSLHRIDKHHRNQCQTIEDVQVPDTDPGAIVDIDVEVTAPREAKFCFVRFKMHDGNGDVAFPGSRPVNFQIIVD